MTLAQGDFEASVFRNLNDDPNLYLFLKEYDPPNQAVSEPIVVPLVGSVSPSQVRLTFGPCTATLTITNEPSWDGNDYTINCVVDLTGAPGGPASYSLEALATEMSPAS